MDRRDATALIAPAVVPGETWGEFGAGQGTFTRALATLAGPNGIVYAIDRDRGAVAALTALAQATPTPGEARVHVAQANFTDPRALDALALPRLDGLLLANALHFVPARDQSRVLAEMLTRLTLAGRLVVVEYEDRRPSPWVPAPVPFAHLGQITPAGSAAPRRIGTHPSAFGGTMYAAIIAGGPAHVPRSNV